MVNSKRVSDSKTEQIQIILPQHINGYRRLFGGTLMEWVDIVASVVARRHAEAEVTTVAIDNLQFKAPAYVNSTVLLIGRITYVGRTSMEVRVDTYVESLSGERHKVNKAYLVLVALDEHERPKACPGLILETDEERREWEAGQKRNDLRKQRRLEKY